jgi:hypothetical protein
VILEDDRKFTRSLSATRQLIPDGVRWTIDFVDTNQSIGVSVEHVVASRITSLGEGRTAKLAFSIATLRWLWGEPATAPARRR